MCTLAVSFKEDVAFPLIVAANRDEARDRPSRSLFAWPGERFVAPRDERAHGTWLGLTATGLFAGVTNRYPAERDPQRRSRGQLVVEALRRESAAAVRAWLDGVEPAAFNAFHLLYCDGADGFISWSDGARLTHLVLGPGVHVVTERSFGGDDAARQAVVAARWVPRAAGGPAPTPEGLMALLRTRGDVDPLAGLCVDVPAFNYGTRSSMVLFRHAELARSRLWWADGPPDVTPYHERPDAIAALAAP